MQAERPVRQPAMRHAGRPRCDVTHKAVLQAAYDLLGESGISRFTIEAVAARSGVARTTIYRWWPSKGALAMEGLLQATAPGVVVAPTDSAAADLRFLLRQVGRLLCGKDGRIIRGIIAEGQSDFETIDSFLTGFVHPRRAEARDIIHRGMASGELRADVDVSMMLSALFGPLHMRMLLNEALDDLWVDRLATLVLSGCLTCPQETAAHQELEPVAF